MLITVHRYNISTGDARVVTGSYNCYFDKAICAPLPCEIDVVWDEPSWYETFPVLCYEGWHFVLKFR